MPTRPWGAKIPKPRKPLSIYLGVPVYERFIRCAKNEQLSPSSIVDTAVDEWLTKHGYAPISPKDRH